MEHIVHPWKPIYNASSRVLILGTIPSPKSREVGFYFGHPQNVFWRALAEAIGTPAPQQDIGAKTAFLLENHVALWDVLHACDIEGASDLSIRNPEPNLFRPMLRASKIRAIFTTGRKATDLFNRLCTEESGFHAIYLPSTSPANRATQAKPTFKEDWAKVRNFI
ncbi:MAG: DNA-deoxyinosine glycosylase [Clostridiales Family XIII bacterium]|nr:DNA-deoxyinosine glycosylase [Clostridiales Family XIII bacterium]